MPPSLYLTQVSFLVKGLSFENFEYILTTFARRSITTQRTYHTTEQTNDKAITINYSVCVRLHESWYCGNNHNGG